MYSSTLRLGVVLAALSVALGAFGAHGLERLVASDRIELFEIGVRYQFYHAFALMITGMISRHFAKGPLQVAKWSFLIGIALFSGSLYLLTFRDIVDLPIDILGLVTPFGGVAFLAGWGSVLIATFRKKTYRSNGSDTPA